MSHRTPKPTTVHHRIAMTVTLLSASGVLAAALAAAQTPAAPTLSASGQPPHAIHKKKTSSPSAALTQNAEPVPPPPDWPINDHPVSATVAWNNPELRIDASNSSLQQILTDVSSATGAQVEGLEKDERVFGSFGPGPARDVISQILQGSGYNIVMVGDQGQGVPREIILSIRNTSKVQAPTRPAPEETEDEAPEYPQYEPPPQPQPQPPANPQPVRPGFPPDGAVPGRIPQQYPGQQPPLQPQAQPAQPAPQNQ